MRLDTVDITALGAAFRLETADEALAAELRRLWAPLLTRAPHAPVPPSFRATRTDAGWQVERGAAVLGGAPDVASLLVVLSTCLNGAAIHQCSELLVHAGAVARGGRVLALAAPSGGGKSTLTAACVSAGWDYVTDEALCLADRGSVLPYQKPFVLSRCRSAALRPAAVAGPGEQLTGIDELGGSLAAQPLSLTDVVFLDRSRSQRPPELVPLHASEVLTGLLALSFNHYKRPAESVARLAAAAERCRAWRLAYTDATEAAALLSDLLPSDEGAAGGDPPGRGHPLSR